MTAVAILFAAAVVFAIGFTAGRAEGGADTVRELNQDADARHIRDLERKVEELQAAADGNRPPAAKRQPPDGPDGKPAN